MNKLIILISIIFISFQVEASRPKLHSFFLIKNYSFKRLLKTLPPDVRCIIDSPSAYRTQIIFTQVKMKNEKPEFTTYRFQPYKMYFYPASTVKLPVAILTLQKLRSLKISPQNFLEIKGRYCGLDGQNDVTQGLSFEEYIARMLVVSNNYAFNPLYDFISRDDINAEMHKHGYQSVNITQRFHPACDSSENRKMVGIRILDKDNNVLYTQDPKSCKPYTPNPADATAGTSYMNAANEKVNNPKPFRASNKISLDDLHTLVMQIIYPNNFLYKFDITNSDRELLMNYMSMLPSESYQPVYAEQDYPDNVGKYFIYGDGKTKPNTDSIKIYNKVGMAYGFMTDCAYIYNVEKESGFFLSATAFVDRDGTLNDDMYAYKELGLPFFSALGQLMYSYEAKRKKK